MKDTYCKRDYKCNCGTTKYDYVWESELRKHTIVCTMCSKELGYANLKAKKAIQMASIRTPTKNR